MNLRATFSGWVYISRAESVPGEWVAHCLDFDIVSQGTSPHHALEMVREAVGMAIADDLSAGLNPCDRRAPDEEWAPLHRLFDHHSAIPVSTMDETQKTFREFAVQTTFEFVGVRAESVEPAKPSLEPSLNWAVAA